MVAWSQRCSSSQPSRWSRKLPRNAPSSSKNSTIPNTSKCWRSLVQRAAFSKEKKNLSSRIRQLFWSTNKSRRRGVGGSARSRKHLRSKGEPAPPFYPTVRKRRKEPVAALAGSSAGPASGGLHALLFGSWIFQKTLVACLQRRSDFAVSISVRSMQVGLPSMSSWCKCVSGVTLRACGFTGYPFVEWTMKSIACVDAPVEKSGFSQSSVNTQKTMQLQQHVRINLSSLLFVVEQLVLCEHSTAGCL